MKANYEEMLFKPKYAFKAKIYFEIKIRIFNKNIVFLSKTYYLKPKFCVLGLKYVLMQNMLLKQIYAFEGNICFLFKKCF